MNLCEIKTRGNCSHLITPSYRTTSNQGVIDVHLEAHRLEDGTRDIRARVCLNPDAPKPLRQYDWIDPNTRRRDYDLAKGIFLDHGKAILEYLYDEPDILNVEKCFTEQWVYDDFGHAYRQWLAREDARRFGIIQPGDFVISCRNYAGGGRIYKWDRSIWRNEFGLIDARDPSKDAISHMHRGLRIRLLTSATLADANFTTDKDRHSSKGPWSFHEILEMIQINQSRDRSVVELHHAYGFT